MLFRSIGLAVVFCLSMAAGIWIGRSQAPPRNQPRKPYYLISVSRITYRDADKWLVEYAIDGHSEQAEVPIKAGEPDGFLGYLDKLK